jgi:hypothetical protein
MLAWGYAIIVLLTCFLVALNVRSAVRQYGKDRNEIRLYSYLATLMIAGSGIIGLSGAIVQRVIDSENSLMVETANSPIQYYRK